MLPSKRFIWLLVVSSLLAAGFAGAQRVIPAQGASGLVTTGSAKILTTAAGKTLYIFSVDKPNAHTSACTGPCAKYWPPLLVPAGTTAPTTMAGVPGKFGELMLKNGSAQLTYGGWPLYTFIKDHDSGDAYGQGVAGSWWVAVVSRSNS